MSYIYKLLFSIQHLLEAWKSLAFQPFTDKKKFREKA